MKLRSDAFEAVTQFGDDVGLVLDRRGEAGEAPAQVLRRFDHIGGEFLHGVLPRIVHVALGAGAHVGHFGLRSHPAVAHLVQLELELFGVGRLRLVVILGDRFEGVHIGVLPRRHLRVGVHARVGKSAAGAEQAVLPLHQKCGQQRIQPHAPLHGRGKAVSIILEVSGIDRPFERFGMDRVGQGQAGADGKPGGIDAPAQAQAHQQHLAGPVGRGDDLLGRAAMACPLDPFGPGFGRPMPPCRMQGAIQRDPAVGARADTGVVRCNANRRGLCRLSPPGRAKLLIS